MPLAGARLQPKQIATLAIDAGFTGVDLYTAVAVCGGESDFYTRAYNDNLDANGNVTSRDVGLWEINIPASEIGTNAEEVLYDEVTNVTAAYRLWKERGWEPWVAYTTGAYLNDAYRIWALLGIQSYYASKLEEAATAAGKTSTIKVPLFSIADLRKKYPGLYIW